jgi:hypothetical protein
VKSMETTGYILYISSKFGKFPANIRVVVAREAYREAWLKVPSPVVALPAVYLVNRGPYRGTTLYLHTFDRVLRTRKLNGPYPFHPQANTFYVLWLEMRGPHYKNATNNYKKPFFKFFL